MYCAHQECFLLVIKRLSHFVHSVQLLFHTSSRHRSLMRRTKQGTISADCLLIEAACAHVIVNAEHGMWLISSHVHSNPPAEAHFGWVFDLLGIM